MSGSTSRRRGEAERRLTEEALLGRLDGSLKWNVVFCVTTLVEMNDVFVSVVWLDEDFVEQRLDVCPVPHGVDGSENESDDEMLWWWWNFITVEEDDLE